MNELLFFGHILLVLCSVLAALRLGKSALYASSAIAGILANLFVTKQIHFFSLTITCSDVFAIQAILSLNLLQEYFGRKEAKRATFVTFFFMAFFAVMSQIHIFYIPASVDTMHGAFQTILRSAPRIVFASIFVFFLVQRIDILLFAFLKKLFGGKYLPLRVTGSLILTQMLDTVLFGFLGLYGLVAHLLDIILLSFCIKLIVIFCTAPFTAFSKRFHKEEADAV